MSEDKRNYSLFPKPLSRVIEPLTRPVFKARGLAGSRILSQWAEVMGQTLAARAYPEKLSFPRGKNTGGTLTIAVENGFATEVQYMTPLILERLAVYYGYKAVERIVISHSYSTPPPAFTAPKPPALPADCIDTAREVDDPDLRAALESLATTLASP